MDQLSPRSRPSGNGNDEPSGRYGTQHARPYSTHSDANRSSSASSYELLNKTTSFNYPSDDETAYSQLPRLASESSAPLLPRRVVTKKNRWIPLTLRGRVAIAMVLLMLATAAGIEIAYAFAQRMNGFSVDFLQKYGSPQFFASFLPVFCVLLFVLYVLTVNHEVGRLQPYISAAHGNAPPEQTVLVSYINQGRIWAGLSALKNGHRIVVISVILSYVTNLWQPLAATLLVVRQTNYVDNDFSNITFTTRLGVQPNFLDLDSFLAAAGYAEAAVVHGLGDPPFVWGGWTVSVFDFPKQPKNATMTLDTQAIWIDTHCESLSPQLNKTSDSLYTVTASRGNCVASFRANQTEGNSAFGVAKIDNCPVGNQSADVGDLFKPVVFWFFTFEDATASMVFCAPSIETHMVNVNVSLSTHLITNEPKTLSDEVTTNVTTGAPLNGSALNGLFFPPSNNTFVSARATAISAAIPNAIHKDAASKPRGLASSLRDIDGQLNRVKTIYTQYLTISAKSNFFLPNEEHTAQPVVKSWIPRLWVDPLAAHVLASLLIFIAISLSILQWVHRRERSRLFLAGPPGSIASDVSMTSSAKFGLLLNAGDTDEDMARKLQGMRFGIEHSTGQIIVEKEHTLPRHIREETRASLLLKQRPAVGPRPAVHRDSFVGLRDEDQATLAERRGRSVVGSLAPSVSSPLASATSSKTTFGAPLGSPSPSATTSIFRFTPAGPTSPPPSSTRSAYAAPPGSPPQRARDSYYDPYAAYPA